MHLPQKYSSQVPNKLEPYTFPTILFLSRKWSLKLKHVTETSHGYIAKLNLPQFIV